MAGRIRTIKPELIEDAVTAGLSHEAFRMFVGMLVLADDHGNLRASHAWLMGQVFHGQPLAGKTIEDVIGELAVKLITLYEADGQPYAHIRGWQKHQRIDNASEPRVPLPPGWDWRKEFTSDGKRARSRIVSFKVEQSAAANRGEPPRTAVAILGSSDLPSVAAATSLGSIDLPSNAAAGSRSPTTTTTTTGSSDAAANRGGSSGPSLSENGKRIARAIAAHTDLFGALTKDEIAPYVARIERPLSALAPQEVWTDLETEVDSWVSYARKKSEGQAKTPTQVLADVEDLARTRCRERPAKARIEREKRREMEAKATPGVLLDVDVTEVERADAELARERRKREEAPKVEPAAMAEATRNALERLKRGAA